MNNLNLEKYKYLDQEYFSTNIQWAYEFIIDGEWFTLDINDKDRKYVLFKKDGTTSGHFSSIYDALDNIKFHNRTIKQLLMETDFNFESIG